MHCKSLVIFHHLISMCIHMNQLLVISVELLDRLFITYGEELKCREPDYGKCSADRRRTFLPVLVRLAGVHLLQYCIKLHVTSTC